MRRALLATLALSPVLLHAQANSPAQPRNTLESRLATPKELEAAGDHAVATAPGRISTGVVAPQFIHRPTNIPIDSSRVPYTGPKTVVVGMIVGADGTPSDLTIVRSAGPIVDKSVLAAVSQYRFKAGTVSNQPVAIPLKLEINLVSTLP